LPFSVAISNSNQSEILPIGPVPSLHIKYQRCAPLLNPWYICYMVV